MASIEVNGKSYETDEEGYLINSASGMKKSAPIWPRPKA